MNATEELVLKTKIAAYEDQLYDLKYELDRLKHEVTLLRISSDSHGRRIEMQSEQNDKIWQAIFKRHII